MAITRFEDLQIWKDSRVLNKNVYSLTSGSKFQFDRNLISQIRRASVSVMSNIAEGFERNSLNDFIRFLRMSKGSCGEIRSIVYVFKDLSLIDDEVYSKINLECINVSTLIANYIKYLKNYDEKANRKNFKKSS